MGKKTCVIIIPWNTTQAATAHNSLGGAMVSEKSRHRRICNAWFHLYEVQIQAKLIVGERSQTTVGKYWLGLGGGAKGAFQGAEMY